MAAKETKEAPVNETAAAGANLSWKEDKVSIKLPKEARGQSNYVIASCNGVVYKIQRGVEVEVPKADAYAETVEHA